jgi:hypothetical protein
LFRGPNPGKLLSRFARIAVSHILRQSTDSCATVKAVPVAFPVAWSLPFILARAEVKVRL